MTYFTKLSLTGGEVPLKSAYDWQSARCIMDVGGGRGEMLSSCMAAAGPAVRGVLMDRPWVLDRCSLRHDLSLSCLPPSCICSCTPAYYL